MVTYMKTNTLMVTAKGIVEMLESELPELGPHDVLVKVKKSMVSPGTERAFILNLENTTANYPFKSGYAACSVVCETGEKVTRLKVGDRVTCFGTAHQTYDIQPESKLAVVPDGVSDEEAVFGALGIICMQGVRKARLELGESCAVIGMGPIGQVALQIAKAAGAYPAIGVDKVQNRLNLAEVCGADETYLSDEAIPDHTVNAIIESTGFPGGLKSAFHMAAPGGRIILLGSTRGDCQINVYQDIHKNGISLIGAHANAVPKEDRSPGRWTAFEDITTFLALIEQKKLNLLPLISTRCSHKDIIQLYQEKILTWDNEVMGAVVNWED